MFQFLDKLMQNVIMLKRSVYSTILLGIGNPPKSRNSSLIVHCKN